MDKELFWKLLEPVHPMAASFCVKLTGNREDGEDLYQDAILAALARSDTLRDQASFKPWLFRIVVNRYKNRCRLKWWRGHVSLSAQVVDSLGGDNPNDRYEARRQLGHLLAMLSPEDRALVVLREIEGWSTEALAAMLNRPEATIKTRLYRARRKMRNTIERHLPQKKANSSSYEVAYAVQRCKTVDE
jgi:RNA polymerase sigma-70 factor (ECF subfamily)